MPHRIRPVAEKCVDELLGYTLRPPLPTSTLKMIAVARRIPLRDLSPDQLRMLLMEGAAVTYLLPFALDHLERDPLTMTRSTHGDLLSIVLHAGGHWIGRPELRERIRAVIEQALARLAPDLGEPGQERILLEPELRAALVQISQATSA